MNKVIEYFKAHVKSPFKKSITVYGWEKNYSYELISSVTPYLFEDLNVTVNLASEDNDNRPLTKSPKFYITVHDTGDTASFRTAQYWNDVVCTMKWRDIEYHASFHYVVGCDGIYQQIPDDEVAYHAGDGTKTPFTLYDSGIDGSNPYPLVSISSDGYYMLDGVLSKVLAPVKKEENGGVSYKTQTSADINDFGILVKQIGKRYYLGETYYNTTYNLIANRGGNLNSIGIESCVNEGTDIYLTWQKTAKLVASLLDKYDIPLDMVKGHLYFSGKNCPETLRMNNLWDHFLDLVKFEYDILKLIKEGYTISLVPISEEIDKNGRIKALTDTYNFKIVSTYKGKTEEAEFCLNIK